MNLAITALVAAMAIPSIASAYTWETCGGNRVRWRSNPTFKASDCRAMFSAGRKQNLGLCATAQALLESKNQT